KQFADRRRLDGSSVAHNSSFMARTGIDKPCRRGRYSFRCQVIRKDHSMMNWSRLAAAWVIFLFSLAGCTAGAYNSAYNTATLDTQEAGDGYCHKKLQPVGPTDPAKLTQSRSGDFIDYYGPCAGPSIAEQIRAQKRFER